MKSLPTLSELVPPGAVQAIEACPFANEAAISALRYREAPYWHSLLRCRHLGIHRPDSRICNWTARILTKDKRYIQKCLGPALNHGRGQVAFDLAVERAFAWFEQSDVQKIANEPKPLGRTREISICPIGEVYTVGHALRDYTDWTRLARSPGGHYNNLVLINHHLIPSFAHLPLEEFDAGHVLALAKQVIETPPRFGFMPYSSRQEVQELSVDVVRRRKRTFNSLLSILRMAFRHAWDNSRIQSERPWRCLHRIPVVHSPRTIFLTRDECQRLLEACTPALTKLVLAALYTGCRVGELGALRVDDVGRQGFGIRVGAFKTGPARFVFLPDEGMAFFLACCEGKQDRDPVFTSDMGRVWRRQHGNLFRRAVSEAHLPKSFVFHGLRHTYASDLVRAGVPLEVVAKQLGHANTITVSNTYGHLSEQFREEQIRTRFSPLSQAHRALAVDNRSDLEHLWHSFQRNDWRDYAQVESKGLQARQAFARGNPEIIQLFGRLTAG
ncbi:tyrosine-type recombinase/integrase [Pseudooceanicola nanhaiensis]|uniref:tyrosine-type recombinase/integrase n=1 Tax=Pseudooceanicola nanhaiensis TaxID=375761 RepID=UPI001CD37821|nr:site-specific integrase [Pseudooceanicola nanhaiensis]MCA0920208.1 site-specific integrase [Pseudooceanicola nanhaiensis]